MGRATSNKGEIIRFINRTDYLKMLVSRCFCSVCRGNRRHFRRERERHAAENGVYVAPELVSHQLHVDFVPENNSDHVPGTDPPHVPSDEEQDDILDPIIDDDDCAQFSNDLSAGTALQSDDEMGNDGHRDVSETQDPHSTLNPLTRFLFGWASKFAMGDKAMNALLRGLTEFDCTGGYYVPKDFRTIHSAYVNETHDDNDDATEREQVSGVTTRYFCESCSMYEFSISDILAKEPCIACNVVTLSCAFPRCRAACLATSRLGKRSIYQLSLCSTCEAGPTSPKITRIYFFDLESQVQRFFRNRVASKSALAPFHVHDNVPLFSVDKTDRKIVPKPDWHRMWLQHIKDLNYKSECWHGSRFFEHPIWKEHGMRSLLLSLFIDWFPPFKKKGYSVGIVSCAVLNLPSSFRNSGFNVWPLAILEGPGLLHSTYVPLRDLCQEIEGFFYNGIRVRDAFTNSLVTVHGVVAQVIGDCPALAKIGMHNGPSSYFSCHRCGFKGEICGHDKTLAEPARFDNVNFNPTLMKEIDRVTLSGSIRKKTKTEHIVWLHTGLIKQDNMRDNCIVLSDQFRVWDKLNSASTRNWAQSRMNKWTSKFRVNGLSPLVHVPHLSLVDDLTTESMHYFIKGILLQLAELTFSQRKPHNKKPYNINRSADVANTFLVRMQQFKLPSGVHSQQGLSGHVHFAKAEPLYTFLKVQALLALEGLVNPQTYECWRLMSEVCSGLLHTHVPKWWIDTRLESLVTQLVETFKIQFGECEMRLGWHFLLHARLDFEKWSTSRSHWAFPGERFCGALIRQVRNASLAKITPSLVKNTSRALAALELEGQDFSASTRPPQTHSNEVLSLPESLRAQVDAYQQRGYRLCQNGVGFYNTVWSVDDFAWICDHNQISVSPTSRLFKIVAILRPRNDKLDREKSHVLVLRRLDQIRLRTGYHNVYTWNMLEPLHSEGVVLDTSVYAPSVHMCEVAQFQCVKSGTVFVPICGNLSF